MTMAPIAHPGRLLKRELAARKLSANRLSLDIAVPSGRITPRSQSGFALAKQGRR